MVFTGDAMFISESRTRQLSSIKFCCSVGGCLLWLVAVLLQFFLLVLELLAKLFLSLCIPWCEAELGEALLDFFCLMLLLLNRLTLIQLFVVVAWAAVDDKELLPCLWRFEFFPPQEKTRCWWCRLKRTMDFGLWREGASFWKLLSTLLLDRVVGDLWRSLLLPLVLLCWLLLVE